MSEHIKIALADDHVLIRKALAEMIESFGNYKVVYQASNGFELIEMLTNANPFPELILLDIQMPLMNGIETAKFLQKKYPDVKIIALTMVENESSMVAMVKCGARGYLMKDEEPEKLREALYNVYHRGFHFSELVTGRLVHQFQHGYDQTNAGLATNELSKRESEFLKLCCTELTYKEIADRLNVSPRTIDGYRDRLFEKLGIKSRVGLAMFAVKTGLV